VLVRLGGLGRGFWGIDTLRGRDVGCYWRKGGNKVNDWRARD
jgi:hypothetical protein